MEVEQPITFIDTSALSEEILNDSLDLVFNYLKFEDLEKASRVCKTWYKVAKDKMSQQCFHIQPFSNEYHRPDFNFDPNFDYFYQVVDSSKIRPEFSMMFTNMVDYQNWQNDMKHYANAMLEQCPIFMIGLVGRIELDDLQYFEKPKNTRGVGFSLTFCKGVYVRSSYLKDLPFYYDGAKAVRKFVNNLMYSDPDQNICVILFNYVSISPSTLRHDIVEYIKRRGRRGKISLWGGSVDKIEHVSLRYHESNNVSVELSPDYFFGASISGPTVNSWSVTIPYYLRDVDAEQKIKNFKRSIALKAHTTGFIMNSIPKSMPPDEERKLDRVELLKKSFPSTTWTVIHRVDYLEQYCTDSTRFGGDTKLVHRECITCLLVSHA